MARTDETGKAHALLSASGSHRWLNCPGSVKAEEPYLSLDAGSSSYAQEGTIAHELADICLKENVDSWLYIDKTINVPRVGKVKIEKEMARYVQEYLDFVRAHVENNCQLFTEEQVDFSNIVPEGFGTLDSAVINHEEGICHIFDLKYGKGIRVDAFENTQGQMYALGFLNEYGFMGDIKSFRIHIVQPRIPNNSYWDISVEDLNKFGEWVTERAELALTETAPRVPGEKQCQWCAAKSDCTALMKFTEEIISGEFDALDDDCLDEQALSDSQKKVIIDNSKLIIDFLGSVKDSVFDRLKDGGTFKGYKLVEGRSNRVWGDDAEETLKKELGEKAYKKTLIGITAAQKELGKEKVDELAYKAPGSPTMVPDTDKRKAIVITDVADEFEEVKSA